MLRIKKDDIVVMIAGKDKGKKGKVLRVIPAESRLVIEGINLVKKNKRKTRQDTQGGIVSMEAPVHISNVMVYDKQIDGPTRFRVSVLKDGSRVRISKKSGAVL